MDAVILISPLIYGLIMGQIRECTICARRMYSIAESNWSCTLDDCTGVMRLIDLKGRRRYVYRGDGAKLGEFW